MLDPKLWLIPMMQTRSKHLYLPLFQHFFHKLQQLHYKYVNVITIHGQHYIHV
jgi:hypothetical protein